MALLCHPLPPRRRLRCTTRTSTRASTSPTSSAPEPYSVSEEDASWPMLITALDTPEREALGLVCAGLLKRSLRLTHNWITDEGADSLHSLGFDSILMKVPDAW